MELNRRDFLKGAALLGTTSAVAGIAGMGAREAHANEVQPPAEEESNATPIEPVEPPESWDIEADCVVVGAGGGGLCAAVYAAQQGLKTVVIEKDSRVGGASRHASGFACWCGGSKAAQELGFSITGDTFDLDMAANIYNSNHQYSCDDKMIKGVIQGIADMCDWIVTLPYITLQCIGGGYMEPGILDGSRTLVLGMDETMNALEKNALELGAQFELTTAAETLVMDGDRVVGVVAKRAATGEQIYVSASKGVILTAGGIGMNLDLLKKYIPAAYMGVAQGGPMPQHTGEAFRMGLGAGADYAGFDSFCSWGGAIDDYWGDGDGKYWHYFWHGESQLVQNPWLLLDRCGNRVPYYTFGGQPEYLDTWGHSMGDLPSVAAQMSRPGHRAYCFFDSHYAENVFKFVNTDYHDTSRIPLTKNDPVPKNSLVSNDWESEVQEAIEEGRIKKADTVEELVEMLGLEPDLILPAIDRWNETCANGIDEDLVVPYPQEWLIPLQDPPFYGCVISGRFGKSGCGLRVNEKMNVVATTGKTIPGLYAGFSTAGGMMGEGSYNGQWNNGGPAGGVGTSCGTGWLAAKSLVENE